MWKKTFSLSDIKYSWVLFVSMVVCGVFFYWDRTSDLDDQLLLSVGYAVSFAMAVLWCAANYVGHIRINAMYRKQNDIDAYIAPLAMNTEEKLELRNYLEDFAQDLMNQGMQEEQATAEAIRHFKVKELLSLSKNSSLFHLHAHYYLFGWAAAAFVLLILLWFVNGLWFPHAVLLLVLETILFVYGSALVLLFFVYKLLDAFLDRTWGKHIS
jgi:4-amino-4-deoxy-L-arabinose transferase-like glycosyltransferase